MAPTVITVANSHFAVPHGTLFRRWHGETTLLQFTDLEYAEGDANEDTNPRVFANAYTNAIDGMTAGETLQFALDAATNSLVTLANNAGTLTTVASLILDGNPFDVDSAGGFDILSFRDESNSISNQAFALLTDAVTSLQAIYSIGLTEDDAGMMKFVSDVPTQYGSLTGFAVAPTPSAVPLPASLPLLAGAVMGFAALRRRTNRKA